MGKSTIKHIAIRMWILMSLKHLHFSFPFSQESLDSEGGSGNADDQPLQLVKKPVQHPRRESSPSYKPLNLKTTPTPLPSDVHIMKKFEVVYSIPLFLYHCIYEAVIP